MTTLKQDTYEKKYLGKKVSIFRNGLPKTRSAVSIYSTLEKIVDKSGDIVAYRKPKTVIDGALNMVGLPAMQYDYFTTKKAFNAGKASITQPWEPNPENRKRLSKSKKSSIK